MTDDTPPGMAAYMDSAAALIGLPVAAAHRAGVLTNLERAAALAALVMEFPLGEQDDAAPVYTP